MNADEMQERIEFLESCLDEAHHRWDVATDVAREFADKLEALRGVAEDIQYQTSPLDAYEVYMDIMRVLGG